MNKLPAITDPQKFIQEVTAILKSNLPEAKFFLFGSRIDNLPDSRSDFDFGIISDQKIPLQILLNIKTKIDDLPTLFQADVVDLNRTSKIFQQEALRKKIDL